MQSSSGCGVELSEDHRTLNLGDDDDDDDDDDDGEDFSRVYNVSVPEFYTGKRMRSSHCVP